MYLLRTEKLRVETFLLKDKIWTPVFLQKDVNISIEENRITCLIGESGAGKSIFAKTVSALLPEGVHMTGGIIFFEEKPVDYNRLGKMRGDYIFYAPQDAAASFNPVYKIERQLLESSKLEFPQIVKILEDLNFHTGDIKRVLNSYAFQLSGGENQRCLLAMAIAQQPRLLILDEPTSALDYDLQEGFMKLVKKIREQYKLTILLVTHNLSIVRDISDYIYIIIGGEIVDQGSPENLFASPNHAYSREIVRLCLYPSQPPPLFF